MSGVPASGSAVGPFEFATAGRVVFGRGRLSELGAVAAGLTSARRVLVVTGRSVERAAVAGSHLAARDIRWETFSVVGEPTVEVAARGAELARSLEVDLIVSIGGGGALDAGKAIAALATNLRPVRDYLEVIGKGLPLENLPLPCVAIPTTAGTGSEATRNAVLSAPGEAVKVSLRSPWMLPRVAIIDPDLTLNLPPDLTASTGMDALTQLIEPMVCNRANPMVDALAREGLSCCVRSLLKAWQNGLDVSARTDMALASLLGGMALANAGLGVVHGLAAPIGGEFGAPHGAVCAALLADGMMTNIRVLRARGSNPPALARYAEVARILTGDPRSEPEDGVNWVRTLGRDMGIQRLSGLGIRAADFERVALRAAQASSMKANPVALSTDDVVRLLADAG